MTAKTDTQDFTALKAWELFNDYILMDALDGTFDAETYAKACVAFTMNDAEGMVKLAQAAEREINFVEASDLFETLDKPKDKAGNEREWSVAERYAILRSTERTRAYARLKLDTLAGDDPFA